MNVKIILVLVVVVVFIFLYNKNNVKNVKSEEPREKFTEVTSEGSENTVEIIDVFLDVRNVLDNMQKSLDALEKKIKQPNEEQTQMLKSQMNTCQEQMTKLSDPQELSYLLLNAYLDDKSTFNYQQRLFLKLLINQPREMQEIYALEFVKQLSPPQTTLEQQNKYVKDIINQLNQPSNDGIKLIPRDKNDMMEQLSLLLNTQQQSNIISQLIKRNIKELKEQQLKKQQQLKQYTNNDQQMQYETLQDQQRAK